MTRLATLLLCTLSVASVCCKKSSNVTNNSPGSQITSYLVTPQQTDNSYTPGQQTHYVVRNTESHTNKLVLFIGGTNSVPGSYNIFCDYAASIGFDVISLSYPNSVAIAELGTSADSNIFVNHRQETCFDTPVSAQVSVDTFNCINTRAIKLLQYLKAHYPDQSWGQYLTAQNTLQWSSIIFAGHSQGSGHACYFGKKYPVARVLMFSGPNDYSTYYNAPAGWLKQTGATPLSSQYALLHVQDEIVPFGYQVADLRGLGLLTTGQNPTLVDQLAAPFANAHSLSTDVAAISYHNATVGANPLLKNVWMYMLRH